MVKLKDVQTGQLFKLKSDTEKHYRLVEKVAGSDGTIYYLTQRGYSKSMTGFYLTNSEKEVFVD